MSAAPGTARIEVRVRDRSIVSVNVIARRLQLAPLLRGQPSSTALSVIPNVYAICRHAQRAAAQAAIAVACGHEPASEVDSAVALEAAREHALHVLTGPAKMFLVPAIRALTARTELQSLLEGPLLGCTIEQWLSLRSAADLEHWARSTQAALPSECSRRLALVEISSNKIALLPPLDAAASLTYWPAMNSAFASTPEFRGGPAQTGTICREADHVLVRALQGAPFLQHWAARLIEWLRFAQGDRSSLLGRVTSACVGPGHGRAAVETGRGTLLHEVTIARERIERYVMVAPTEWNFHPRGPAWQWLQGAQVGSTAEAGELAKRVAEALDPCVPCECLVD